jgi:hypothetical protein
MRNEGKWRVKIGDLVMAKVPKVRKGRTTKLARLWQGPFRIMDLKGNVATLELVANPIEHSGNE